MSVQFWLADLGPHGNPTLVDGPHSDRAGVEQARYLIEGLALDKGRRFACAEVRITDVEAKKHGTNEQALGDCLEMLRRQGR